VIRTRSLLIWSLLLKAKFLGKLPAAVRLHLAGGHGGLRQLAERADPLCREARASRVVAAVEVDQRDSGRLDRIEASLEALVAQVRAGQPAQRGGRGRGRGGASRGGRQNYGAAYDASDSPLCYFHWRFKAEATKCKPPCAWEN
jgi:hypothetical protein